MPDEMPLPLPTQRAAARIFVGIELLWPLLGGLGGLTMGLFCRLVGGQSWWLALLFPALGLTMGLLLQLINMVYRTINYLLTFMVMAELLDQTRILITSMFSPGNRPPKASPRL